MQLQSSIYITEPTSHPVSVLIVVNGHMTRSGTRTRRWLHLSPETSGRLMGWVRPKSPTKGLGRGTALEDGSVTEAGLWLLPSIRFCPAVPGPEARVWNSSAPPVSPPLASTRGPSVIAKESVAESELRMASLQGPGLPSLLGTFGQGAGFPQPSTSKLT